MNSETIKEATKAVWGTTPAGSTYAQGHTKGTKEFFQAVIEKRFKEECDWMEDVVNFKRFKGKKVLEIGCGAGYDAYQFCKNGADYTGIDITPDNPIITKKHLSFFNYEPHVLEMDVESLSVSETFDYVFSFGVLHHTPNFKKALKNIYNVLKSDGEAQIIVYYKHSIFYILHVVVGDWLLRLKFLKMSLKERRSKIETTLSNAEPLVNVYSKKELHALCKEAGFHLIKTDIRKLTREDLPDLPFVKKLYPYIPDSWLTYLSKKFGWYISVRMKKVSL